jgi:signal transduction histidine kinase
MTGGALPTIPDTSIVVPVIHQGDLLGALSLAKPPGESLTPAEEKLLADLASQAGLILRNVGLTAELEARLNEISAQAEELRASRQRIIKAQDAERRRLERNIHDGAQQHLVALAVKLRLAKTISAGDPAKARGLLEELQTESTEALDTLRDLARGIYPPLLEERGIVEALRSQVKKSLLPVRLEADEQLQRFPIDLETAAYFCCLEALQNATKSADASEVVILLADTGGDLGFAVKDDGIGFDPAAITAGSGLQNMRDRVEALGGTLRIESALGSGTTVSGSIPSRELETVT